LLRLPVILFN